MNNTDRPRHRPRNRQPRPSQQTTTTGSRGGKSPSFAPRPRPAAAAASSSSSSSPQQRAGTVPPSRLIVPGAPVFIIQKQDQPTGRETRGVVQDVLTWGDHPRGVKVRLRDGRVGRVQRLDAAAGAGLSSEEGGGESVEVPAASSSSQAGIFDRGSRARNRYSDVRNDGLEGPPPRTLADYMTHLDGLP